MNLTMALVPASWALIADFILLLVVILIYYTFPRTWFAQNYNIFMAVCVFLMVLWFMKAGIRDGMVYHFSGATLLLLMLGWQLAILGILLEVTVLVIMGTLEWQVLAINVLLMGVLPVIISSIILSLVERIENNHFIIYFFVGTFFNAAFTVALSVFISSMFMVMIGAYTYDYITYEYMPYIFLMIYPEAFLTGLIMIILIVNYPRCVRSFYDDKYPFGRKD